MNIYIHAVWNLYHMGDGGHVLVVEDDTEQRAAYDRVLSEFYAVSTAASGAAAVETVTDGTDVVLIDRPLPETTVDSLAGALMTRQDDCYVALVTGSEPCFDISRWPSVDDYLVKPVTVEQLRDTVDRLLTLAEYDEIYRTLSQKRVRKSVLAQEQQSTRKQRGSELARVTAAIERLERELDEIGERLDEVPGDLER